MIERRGDVWLVRFGFWIGPGVFLTIQAEVERETRDGRCLLPWRCNWNEWLCERRAGRHG